MLSAMLCRVVGLQFGLQTLLVGRLPINSRSGPIFRLAEGNLKRQVVIIPPSQRYFACKHRCAGGMADTQACRSSPPQTLRGGRDGYEAIALKG